MKKGFVFMKGADLVSQGHLCHLIIINDVCLWLDNGRVYRSSNLKTQRGGEIKLGDIYGKIPFIYKLLNLQC